MQQPIFGTNGFRYKYVPNWAQFGTLKVGNGHGVVVTKDGYIVFVNDAPDASLVILDPKSGRVQYSKSLGLKQAHGLSLQSEDGRDVLFVTCLGSAKVIKVTLYGELLAEYPCPVGMSAYTNPFAYKPSWTVHHPKGAFKVLDGYGEDFVLGYDKQGNMKQYFGGKTGGIPHWGPHAGHYDIYSKHQEQFYIAMSDQRSISTWSWDGKKTAERTFAGSDPRMLRPYDNHWIVGHIGGKWPEDYQFPGYVTVHDRRLDIVSCIGADPVKVGSKQPLVTSGNTPFRHPHDVFCTTDGSMYVAQYASGDQPLLKLERV